MLPRSYRPAPIEVDSTYTSGGREIGGFLPWTSGTITIEADVGVSDPYTVVDTMPVTGGIFVEMPMLIDNAQGFTVTLAGGASGTLLV